MNNRIRRAQKDLEALGFYRDYDTPSSGMVYRHPNQPGEHVKLHPMMSDSGVTAVMRLANKIADTGWSGPRQPQRIKERAQILRHTAATMRAAEDAERQKRAEAAEAGWAARVAREQEVTRILADRRHDREIRTLMQPGFGR